MGRFYPNFIENISRYLFSSGNYPYDIKVKTPVGIIKPRLYSHHDILTVNEIFCRLDYPADQRIKTVVDLGSNIGISALYFLSRNKESKCYLYEPDNNNIIKLIKNLAGFETRYKLFEYAVSHEKGQFEFGVEPTGRYGGIGVETGNTIMVKCLAINEVLKEIIEKEQFIDILKIDTEGLEEKTVEAIDVNLMKKIKRIYIESIPKNKIHSNIFEQKQYGSVCQLINKQL